MKKVCYFTPFLNSIKYIWRKRRRKIVKNKLAWNSFPKKIRIIRKFYKIQWFKLQKILRKRWVRWSLGRNLGGRAGSYKEVDSPKIDQWFTNLVWKWGCIHVLVEASKCSELLWGMHWAWELLSGDGGVARKSLWASTQR